MSKILRNVTGSAIVVTDTGGVTIASGGQYTIPPQDYPIWAASSNTVTYVGDGDLVVNDGSFDLSISDGIDLVKGLFPPTQVEDTAAPSGFRGYPVLGVRNDNNVALTDNDLDFSPIAVDFAGRPKEIAVLDPYVSPQTERTATSGTANTETSVTLRPLTRRFTITNRGSAVIKLSYTATESGTQYRTLYPNAPYPEDNVGEASLTFYVQSPSVSQDLEITSWL